MRVLLTVISLVVLSSCGGSGTSKSPNQGISQNETIMADGSNVAGIYASDIWPVNYNLNLDKIGVVALRREGDQFSAFVKMQYAPKGIRLKQAIYSGRRCPSLVDDLNKDAYIDIQEALVAIGQITIPLDGRLDSQQAGLNDFPETDSSTGMFSYHEEASFARMFADLKVADENPSDNIIKLGADEGITFPGRVVLFQGLSPGAFLPTSVASRDGLSAYDTLPVGCAVLWKVENLPDVQ